MKNTEKFVKGALLTALTVSVLSFPAFAKEERTPVGHITLNVSYEVQAGESGGYVDVTVEEGECCVESVDFINEGEYWLGGDKPKVEIWLAADSDYYFSKSGKSQFTLEGDEAKYVSSSKKNDKEELVLRLQLEKLDKDDEDLDVPGLYWDEDNGIAHWDHLDIAKEYKVRLCKSRSSSSFDDGIGSTYTVKENSFDFSGKFPQAGTYYFKVKAVDAGNNSGDWEESSNIEVTQEDLEAWKGSWVRDDKGWWYSNADGTYTQNNWQYIDSKWYFFNQDGYMMTGWIKWQDKEYFCDESGAMLSSCTTPDGFNVGADGAKIQ